MSRPLRRWRRGRRLAALHATMSSPKTDDDLEREAALWESWGELAAAQAFRDAKRTTDVPVTGRAVGRRLPDADPPDPTEGR